MRKNTVKTLTPREHMLTRPGMYIGNITPESSDRYTFELESSEIKKQTIAFVPALLKLVDEIVSNSVDEYLRTEGKFANKISVEVNQSTNSISVVDNGRGVPINKLTDAFTKTLTGANFEDGHISIGMNGVGSTAVNVFSTSFIATTIDINSGKRGVLTCSSNMSNIKESVKDFASASTQHGTKVVFQPDLKRFGIEQIDEVMFNLIKKRITDLAACYSDIVWKFNKSRVQSANFKHYAKLYSPDAITFESDDLRIAVWPSESPDCLSFINGIDVFRGGTHTDYYRAYLGSKVKNQLSKKHRKLNLSPSDITNKLTFLIVSNKISSPRFDSQLKERLAQCDNKLGELFKDALGDGFINKIAKSEAITGPIIDALLAKIALNEKRQLAAAKRKAKNVRVEGLIKATTKNPDEVILFLTEGLSAIGMLMQVRDKTKHAGFALKGKVLNVSNVTTKKILENKELVSIMNAAGLEIGKEPEDLNVGQIGIMTDADADGSHIAALLVNFFYTFWPSLIRDGKLCIVRSPIVIATKGKKVHNFYNLSDFQNKESELSGYSIKYAKGLGSLTPAQYKDMVSNSNDFVTVSEQDAKESSISLNVAFGADSSLRKQWLTSTCIPGIG